MLGVLDAGTAVPVSIFCNGFLIKIEEPVIGLITDGVDD
jgi:hypothetical protein